MTKKITIYILFVIASCLASCSRRDYVNTIPANSTALISVNAIEFVNGNTPFTTLLAPFASEDRKELKGIDLTKDIYLFETADGTLGLCAPVGDDYELSEFLKRMKGLGAVKPLTEKDDVDFYLISESCILAHSDGAMLAMGPVTGQEAQDKLIKRMLRYFAQDEETSIRKSMIWEHMQELSSTMRMVAQASALPEQMVASFTIGSPKGTDPADVLVEAELSFDDGTLYLDGSTCSYNPNIKQSLQKASQVYKPLTINWEKMMNDTTLVGVFMNVNGEEFMPHLQTNKALNTMLLGTNAYDRIKNNHGDLAILLTPKEGNSLEESFTTRVINLVSSCAPRNDKLVVAINLKALNGTVAKTISPFLGRINRIIYRLKQSEEEKEK